MNDDEASSFFFVNTHKAYQVGLEYSETLKHYVILVRFHAITGLNMTTLRFSDILLLLAICYISLSSDLNQA